MCTLGKRVYGNVPRVQIPPAAPFNNNSNQNGSDFFILLILLFFVFLLLLNFEIKKQESIFNYYNSIKPTSTQVKSNLTCKWFEWLLFLRAKPVILVDNNT